MTDIYNRRNKVLNDEGKSVFQEEVPVVSNCRQGDTPADQLNDKNLTNPGGGGGGSSSKCGCIGFGHILTNSHPFRTLTNKAFDVCDVDGSGTIDKTELYAGMLLIHLNLAKYAGPAACYPPTRQVCEHLFEAADWDNNGTIDRQEFAHIIAVLCSQILQRMMIYYMILILAVPILASKAVEIIQIDDQNNDDSFLDMVANQTISLSLFFLAIPLIWNKIDDSSKRRLVMMKQPSTTPAGTSIQRDGQQMDAMA